MTEQPNLLDLIHASEMAQKFPGTWKACQACNGCGTRDRQWPTPTNGCSPCGARGRILTMTQQPEQRIAA